MITTSWKERKKFRKGRNIPKKRQRNAYLEFAL